MKTRRWIIVIALFVGFTALVLYHGWNLVGANDKIRNYLITTLRPVVGNDFNIKKLDISIGAIHLIGVNLSFKNNYLNIKVEDIRLGFNFFNLIKSGFRPQKIPQDIIFVKPQITFRAIKKTESPVPAADSNSSKIDKDKYLQKIADFNFIKRITISKGKISYIDSTFHEIILGDDINGWLSARDLASTTTRLVGKVFNSQNYNLSMTGNIDLVKGHLDLLTIKLKNYELNKEDLYFVPDYFDISRGTVDGTISLTEKKYGETGFDIDGQFSITDGAVKVVERNLFFDDINLKAKIQDWNCMVTNSSLLLNGSPVEISGKIINILNPKLDLAIQSPALDVEKFIQKMVPNTALNIKGLSSIHFNVSNTLENPSFWGELKSDKLFFNNKQFQNMSAHISFKDTILSVNFLKTQIEEVNATTFFKIDFTRKIPGIQFSLNSSGNLFSNFVKVPFKSLQKSRSLVSIDGKGDFENFSGNMKLQIKTFLEPDTTFNFNGDFSYEQQKFDLNINSRSHLFNGNAEFDLSGSNVAMLVNLNGLHNLLYDFSETRKIKKFFDFKESSLQIEGQKEKLAISGDFLWNKQNGDPERSANIIFSVKSNDDAVKIAGNAEVFCGSSEFNGNFDLLKYSEILEINNFDVKNILIANGRIHLNGDNAVEANILFSDTPLKDFARLIFRDSKSVNQGKLYGSLGVFGTLKNPNISCKLDLSDLIVNNIGTYTGTTSFSLKDKRFVLDKFTINKNEQIIFDARGNYRLDNDKYNFDFDASKIDINSTLMAMFNKAGLLTGNGTGKIMLRGSSKHPRFFGNLLIEQGKFSRFYFDRLFLKLDQLNSAQGIDIKLSENEQTVNGIRLNQVLFVRNGEFQMQGQGFIPFSNEDSLDVELKGEGNILSILPELTTFFKKTRSKGKWGIRLGGSPENIVVSEGEIEISDGYLRLRDVAPEIKDISMKAKLEHGGFFSVKHISGKIRRKNFVFRNVRALTQPTLEKLQPFLINGLGLNLGVFILETSDKGIPLHIPGFMQKNEFGYYCFTGKNETENFYFAGPFEKPYVRGKIHLQNVNFTFPFITKNSNNNKSDAVVSVLRSMEWDVDAVIGQGLHYQRKIPSGLDNVYLDVILDSGVGGLSFNGILKNDTFRVTGFTESSRGNVEYLNIDFQITKAGVEFDMGTASKSKVELNKSFLLPIIYAKARTTVTDSTGFPYYIYLTLLTKDPATGYTKKRGRLGEVTFQLTSESSALGDTEGEILASLGYSPENLRGMATNLIGISTDNLVFRPLFRPFERKLEQRLGLDMVRFSSRFTRNLIEMNVNEERNYFMDSKLFLLRSTKLMVGKYLADQLFLTYSGELEAGMDYRYQHEGFGVSHKFGLEYRINPTLLLQMEYDYNTLMLMRRDDKRILLRHSFPF